MDSAGIPWYSTGTVNVTQGSSNVAGVGTNWVNAGLKVGDIFTIDKSRLYQITAINSNTSLSLQEAYQGATGTAQVYFVIRNFAGTMQAQIAAQVSELVNKYESYIDTELKQITGPAGPTSFPYRGTWTTGRTYNGLDVVQYGNQLYMALYGHTSTSANAPGATGTAWTQLTFDAAFSAVKAELAALANAGAKNLLRPNFTTRTVSGITFALNDDGSVTLNGTATVNVSINNAYIAYLKVGSYKLNGAPKATSGTFLRLASGETGETYIASVNDEYTLTVAQDGYYTVGPFVNNGKTIEDMTISPMIRDASITDDAYVPYGMSNAELTAKINDDTGWQTLSGRTKYRKENGWVHIRVYETGNSIPTVIGGEWSNIYTLPANARPTEIIEGAIMFRRLSGNVYDIFPSQIDTSGVFQIMVPNGTNINSTTHNIMAGGISFPV